MNVCEWLNIKLRVEKWYISTVHSEFNEHFLHHSYQDQEAYKDQVPLACV